MSEPESELRHGPLEHEVARASTQALEGFEGTYIDESSIPLIVSAIVDEAQLAIVSASKAIQELGMTRTSVYRVIKEARIPKIEVENTASITNTNLYLKRDVDTLSLLIRRQKEIGRILKGEATWPDNVSEL